MMRRWIFRVLLILVSMPVSARTVDSVHRQGHAETISLMESYARMSGFENLAVKGLARRSFLSATTYDEYCLKELLHKELYGQFSWNGNALSLSVSHWGYARYGEYCVSVGYSRVFAQRLSVGLNFHYLGDYAYRYDLLHSVTFDVSFYCAITSRIGIGGRAYNPVHLKYGVGDESASYLPMIFDLNLHCVIGRRVLLYLQSEKELGTRMRFLTGVICQPVKLIRFDMKVGFPVPSVALNVGFCWQKVELEVGAEWRTKLGVVPRLSLCIPFKNSKL